MKKLIFIPFLLLLLMTACQKEELIISSTSSTISTLSLQQVDDLINQIDFAKISTENGILHFEDVKQLKQTISILDEAEQAYNSFIKNENTLQANNELNYDVFFVAKKFTQHFANLHALIFNQEEEISSNNFLTIIPASIQSILNSYGEVVLNDKYQRFFSNGAYEELVHPDFSEIEKIRRIKSPLAIRALCHFAEEEKKVHFFKYCGKNYGFINKLGYYNVDAWDVHKIFAYGKVYRIGNNAPVNARMEVNIEGKMSIGCGESFRINIPNTYNTNLDQNGNVPNRTSCVNCFFPWVNITYSKDITRKDNQDFLKATYRVVLDGCDKKFDLNTFLLIQ